MLFKRLTLYSRELKILVLRWIYQVVVLVHGNLKVPGKMYLKLLKLGESVISCKLCQFWAWREDD